MLTLPLNLVNNLPLFFTLKSSHGEPEGRGNLIICLGLLRRSEIPGLLAMTHRSGCNYKERKKWQDLEM